MIIKGRRFLSTSLSGSKVIIHGDSITADAGASDHNHAYYMIYQTATGYPVTTMAQYSRTVQEAVQSWNATNSLYNVVFDPTPDQELYNPLIPYDPTYRYLMFRLGINDCLQKPSSSTNVTTFKDTYKECLQAFLDLGWPKNKIKLINISSYLGADAEVIQACIDYRSAIEEIGEEMEFQVLNLQPLDAANNPPDLYADLVHPNDAGHLLHGNYLISQLP